MQAAWATFEMQNATGCYINSRVLLVCIICRLLIGLRIGIGPKPDESYELICDKPTIIRVFAVFFLTISIINLDWLQISMWNHNLNDLS